MPFLSDALAYGLPRHEQDELIDSPGLDQHELHENLCDMGRVNRFGGGVALSQWALGQFVHFAQKPEARRNLIVVLDVGCGIGDIPRAFAANGVRVVATDISPQITHMAANESVPHSVPVLYAAADGMQLPLADASVDVAHCSFALHHFMPTVAVAFLREMQRVARQGIIVNDLVRSWAGIGGAWLLGHAISRNRLTRHDGLVSARRAYTLGELHKLAAQAGLHVAAQRVIVGYRAALVLKKDKEAE